MPQSGWGEWGIWLKLASKQRQHLNHNERSEYALVSLRVLKKPKVVEAYF
jgi:hypothetical protein